MKYSVALGAIFVSYVAAQSGTSSAASPTSTNSISQCILNCSAQAATSAGCDTINNISCVCGNAKFLQLAKDCLTTKCSTEEQQAAVQFQQQLCSACTSTRFVEPLTCATGSSSGSATPTQTATSSAASASSTATTPASSGSTSSVSASSASRTSSVVGSASPLLSSLSSAAASATSSSNAALRLPTFDSAAAGLWAVVAFGGIAVAQIIL